MRATRGRYRIQAVAEMTGVQAATLRAWERRYGVPIPERTTSSYRLYSDADVAMIRRLRTLCEEGMAPAQAAQLVLSDPKLTIVEAPASEAEGDASAFAVAQRRILEAVEEFDPMALDDAVRGAMFVAPADVAFENVLAPALRVIGDRWRTGEFSVAQEHMASEAIVGAAKELLRLMQLRESARRVVLACTADEQHALPVYGVAFRFVAWGFHAIVLGARTPPVAIRYAREAAEPHLVGLSVTTELTRDRARQMFDEYAAALGGTPWIVGGASVGTVAEIVRDRGGHVCVDPAIPDRARIEAILASARAGASPSPRP